MLPGRLSVDVTAGRPSRRGVSRNVQTEMGITGTTGRPSRRGVSRNSFRPDQLADVIESPLPQGRE